MKLLLLVAALVLSAQAVPYSHDSDEGAIATSPATCSLDVFQAGLGKCLSTNPAMVELLANEVAFLARNVLEMMLDMHSMMNGDDDDDDMSPMRIDHHDEEDREMMMGRHRKMSKKMKMKHMFEELSKKCARRFAESAELRNLLCEAKKQGQACFRAELIEPCASTIKEHLADNYQKVMRMFGLDRLPGGPIVLDKDVYFDPLKWMDLGEALMCTMCDDDAQGFKDFFELAYDEGKCDAFGDAFESAFVESECVETVDRKLLGLILRRPGKAIQDILNDPCQLTPTVECFASYVDEETAFVTNMPHMMTRITDTVFNTWFQCDSFSDRPICHAH